MLTYPHIDPVAFTVFSWPVRWYGLSYSIGLVSGWYLLHYHNAKYAPYFFKSISATHINNIFPYIIIACILGTRLSHMLFYEFDSFVHHPLSLFRIDQGGMSFHGALIGGIAAIYVYSRHYKLSFSLLCDIGSLSIPIGLAGIRIANFINAELYGRITYSGWGMVFPGHQHPRHPSQLYEAFFEGVVLFILLRVLFPYAVKRQLNGLIAGVFFLGYGLARFFVEYVREPVDGEFQIFGSLFSYGQILTAPMILIGLVICLRVLLGNKESFSRTCHA
jgi:phosphatidylglycerol:prolipoprotein diacylglycerol transferase